MAASKIPRVCRQVGTIQEQLGFDNEAPVRARAKVPAKWGGNGMSLTPEKNSLRIQQAFIKHMLALLESIDYCLSKQYVLPCLTLLYAGIDVIASLEARPREAVKKSFTRWVSKYLLKDGSFQCNAVDLYAARCGVIHTFTPESDLSRAGKARQIAYAWGDADVSKLIKASDILGRRDIVSVHLRDLVAAFRRAFVAYLEEIDSSPEKQRVFEKAAGIWFVPADKNLVDELLELHQRWEIQQRQPPPQSAKI